MSPRPPDRPEGASAAAGEPRALIIDDTDLVRELFRDAFGPERIATAATVDEALRLIEADASLRILLVDLNMRKGGIPFLRTLRARFPDRLLVVISAEASSIDARLQRELGIFRALEKGTTSLDDYERALADAAAALRRGA